MATAITIENLDAELVELLESEAKRRGVSVEAAACELLKEGLLELKQKKRPPRPYTLKSLAGTWSEEQAREFEAAVKAFERIDAELWQ